MKAIGSGSMKENAERIVRVGLKRKPKAIFDEIDSITAAMVRNGWIMHESMIEETLGNVHIIFQREVDGKITESGY
jgi:hypothetical protein